MALRLAAGRSRRLREHGRQQQGRSARRSAAGRPRATSRRWRPRAYPRAPRSGWTSSCLRCGRAPRHGTGPSSPSTCRVLAEAGYPVGIYSAPALWEEITGGAAVDVPTWVGIGTATAERRGIHVRAHLVRRSQARDRPADRDGQRRQVAGPQPDLPRHRPHRTRAPELRRQHRPADSRGRADPRQVGGARTRLRAAGAPTAAGPRGRSGTSPPRPRPAPGDPPRRWSYRGDERAMSPSTYQQLGMTVTPASSAASRTNRVSREAIPCPSNAGAVTVR